MTDNPGSPIDQQVLAGLEADTSRDLIPELIGIFLKTADERASQIHSSLKTGSLEQVAAEAHALKSSSATFGATEVRRIRADLEIAGKNNDHAGAAQLSDALTGALEEARQALADYISNIPD